MAAEYTDKLKKKIKEMNSGDLFSIICDACTQLYNNCGELNISTTSRDETLNIDFTVKSNKD